MSVADVGTHLVDLVSWMLFPNQALDHRRDLQVQQGRRWPTTLSRDDFRRVTGASDFPDYLTAHTRNGQLDYFCNTAVSYRLRGIQVRLNILWEYESAAGGGDTHLAPNGG